MRGPQELSCKNLGLLIAISFSATASPATSSALAGDPLHPVLRPSSAAANSESSPPTLASIIDKLDWDPATRGALMIVSAKETVPFSPASGATAGPDEQQPQTLDLTSAGTYATARAASYFDRRLVGINSVTVFAPRTMTVLNYERLPKLDPYIGLSAAQKLSLLESTFTDAQWASAASYEGIGAADMNPRQSAIFLSMLPQPFVVEAQPGTGERISGAASLTLTAEQRADTCLKLQKRLDCLFFQGEKVTVGLGSDDGRADSSYNYRLPFAMPAFMRRRSSADMVGVKLTSVVPSRAKPTQLPADWGALDVTISLRSAKTVGALVAQIAKQTGARLYCDPRYVDRSLILRGDSARAVDLLNALSRAVTGAWRRVGDAFVLTDDLVGLGVRHVKIDDWEEQNSLPGSLLMEKAYKLLSGKEYRAIGWSSSDPYRPDDALVAKLDAFVAQPAVPLPGSGPSNQLPTIPMADLPQALQDHMKEQLANYREMLATRPDNGNSVQAVRSDAVKLAIQVQASYIVPGVGRLAATNLTGMDGHGEILGKPYTMPWNLPPRADSSAITLKDAPAARALLIDTKDPKSIAALAAEARRRGLNQLWVVVPPGDTALLEAAVVEGRNYGLAVHAVARLLRASPTAPASTLDRNLLGETLSQYVNRRRLQVADILAGTGPIDPSTRMPYGNLALWLRDGFADMFLRRGDFRLGTEAERAAIAAEVGRIAAVPGLAGIVIQDKASPGSEPPYSKEEGNYYAPFSGDFGMQMGYDEATRLDCLKELGFDPIDLSPLPSGDELLDIGIPLFRDSGGVTQQSVFYGHGRKAADKSLWTEWTAFRHRRSVALVEAVKVAARAVHADLPILISRYDDPTNGHYNWYGSFDKPAGSGSPIPPPKEAAMPNGGTLVTYRSLRERAADESRTCYFPMPLGGVSSFQGRQSIEQTKVNLVEWLKEAPKWDGLVIDVGNASPDEALALLVLLPVAKGK